MKAKKLPSGSYRVRLSVGKDPKTGKYVYKSFTADTAKEAERLAYEYMFQKEKIDKAPVNFTLEKAMEEFNENREYTLSPRTAREYEIYRKGAYNDIKDMYIGDINSKIVQLWINNCSLKNSPKTVKNKYAYLTSVLSFYRPELKLNCALPKKKQTEYHVVTNEEMSIILKATEGTELGLAIRLATFTPARRSEICALTSEDVKDNKITINKAMVKDKNNCWVIKSPKSYAGYRTVEMPYDIICQLKENPINLNPDGLYKSFKKLLKNLNLPDMRFHDLRHYGATILHEKGVPDKEIMYRGGWNTLNTLMNIYVHYTPDGAKNAAKAMNDVYSSLME